MYGFQNESIVYGVIDLIRDEMKKARSRSSSLSESSFQETEDPFSGIPNVSLFRNLPNDIDQLTDVSLEYQSGYYIIVQLGLGSLDTDTFPTSLSLTSPEAEFYYTKRLNNLIITSYNAVDEPIVKYYLSLHYNGIGQLVGTTVDKL